MSAPASPAADCVQNVTILGATGSIGTSTLDVLARHPQRYRVFALSARSRLDALLALCQQHRPAFVAVPEAAASDFARQLRKAGLKTEVCPGERGLYDIAAHNEAHVVMAAIVGAAGLPPVLAAANAGKRILLANKESLVMGGQLVLDAVRRHGATLLPVDSEHSAIFQCLPAG
ncbi:MAG: 1-deoxy-D-xylulose-5-phosphate reductoisomerase, partial [Rhodocyclaceae bacterium]|nr:1-deoxy-D-xylulose-5-phosphate reductoisomerase [Rhodocyclaceae bacterium]